MQYINTYQSPVGTLIMTSQGDSLTGLWYEERQKHLDAISSEACENSLLPIFQETQKWLTIYFSGRNPLFIPPISLSDSDFRMNVWRRILQIPYGETVTYGQIAKEIATKQNMIRMSAQAVGGAVGHNPIAIIVPCHRVVGTNGALTGYAGGIERKKVLLALEKEVL